MRILDLIGPEKCIWASDYPHPESTLGYSAAVVRDVFDAAGDEHARKIVGGTAVDLWGLN